MSKKVKLVGFKKKEIDSPTHGRTTELRWVSAIRGKKHTDDNVFFLVHAWEQNHDMVQFVQIKFSFPVAGCTSAGDSVIGHKLLGIVDGTEFLFRLNGQLDSKALIIEPERIAKSLLSME